MTENPLIKHFKVLVLVAIICGLLIGYGLAMVLGSVRVCTMTRDPATLDITGMVCKPLDPYTRNDVALALLFFGAVAGVIPHTPQFHGLVSYFTGKLEKKAEQEDIREYFERYS